MLEDIFIKYKVEIKIVRNPIETIYSPQHLGGLWHEIAR
jgi:hypothetical protein